MQAVSSIKAIFLGICLSSLVACEDVGSFGSQTFQSRYEAARSALENEKYDKANRIYVELLETAGPHQPRLRLEYAHSLLRAGEYDNASKQASFVAQGQTGTARGAALVVVGVAEHERGLVAIQDGDLVGGKQHLLAAQTAINEVLKIDSSLDASGALANRKNDIETRLKAIG